MDSNVYEALRYINPDDYDDWLKVGMALKHEGCSLQDWEEWSSSSSKYAPGVCAGKWRSFREQNAGAPVTAGTIVQMAKDRGMTTTISDGFDWDDPVEEISKNYNIIDKDFVKEEIVPEPQKNYKSADDLCAYLSELFERDEYVGYCDRLTDENGRWVPKHGIKTRTAGELIDLLKQGGFTAASIKEESEGGAMIRFNPLDGVGESDANVTKFRYCLVESDKDSIEKQYGLYKAMNLPIKVLVNSGNKSLHAIVRVDAESAQQYRDRVNRIYEFCGKSGLQIDEQDKNASRYSRMPGILRNGKRQYTVAMNIGANSYKEWVDWLETQNDNLPDDISLADVWEDMPPVKEELIENVLRVGHKMLVSGPSKAGKSYLLIELAICIAEGREWLGNKCKQGKVVYLNMELDQAECYQRFKQIYDGLGIEPKNIDNIRIWNLRGYATPMDKLAPLLINRFKDKKPLAVIVDPIYKVITGDENSATEMSKFCSYFDRCSEALKTAMIYCHHHSKDAGNKYSNAMDRASGSGVFARDPDAILDLTELNPGEAEYKYKDYYKDANASLSAWEITYTLRSFPPRYGSRLWFDHPIHRADELNILGGAKYKNGSNRGKGNAQTSKEENERAVAEAFENLSFGRDYVERDALRNIVGMSDSKLKDYVGKDTRWEPATISTGEQLIIRRNASSIERNGVEYMRPKQKNSKWWPRTVE